MLIIAPIVLPREFVGQVVVLFLLNPILAVKPYLALKDKQYIVKTPHKMKLLLVML